MNKLDQTVVQSLKAIESSCPRLLNALHYSPEVLWGEIQALEYACKTFEEAPEGAQSQPKTLAELMELTAALRAQLARQGLNDDQELDGFRQKVVAIQTCARTMLNNLR